jgi:hypothetical protein
MKKNAKTESATSTQLRYMQMDLVIVGEVTIFGGGTPLSHDLHTAAKSVATYSAVLRIVAERSPHYFTSISFVKTSSLLKFDLCLRNTTLQFAACITNGEHVLLLLGNQNCCTSGGPKTPKRFSCTIKSMFKNFKNICYGKTS